jgi:hypothetical protein
MRVMEAEMVRPEVMVQPEITVQPENKPEEEPSHAGDQNQTQTGSEPVPNQFEGDENIVPLVIRFEKDGVEMVPVDSKPEVPTDSKPEVPTDSKPEVQNGDETDEDADPDPAPLAQVKAAPIEASPMGGEIRRSQVEIL